MKVKKIFLTTALVLALAIKPVSAAWLQLAQVDTSLPEEASQEAEESTIQNIKKVIQEKQLELGEASHSATQERQAYLAQIKRVSEETLTLRSNKGNKIVPLTKNLIISKANTEIAVEKLAVDNWVVVYGLLENDNFVPKKISVTSYDFTTQNRKVLLGTITELYSLNLSFTPRASEEKLTFILNKKTNYQDFKGEEADWDDFYKDIQCLIVAKEDDDGDLTISSIRALGPF